MFFVFPAYAGVAGMTDSFAFTGVCVQVPIRLQAPGGGSMQHLTRRLASSLALDTQVLAERMTFYLVG